MYASSWTLYWALPPVFFKELDMSPLSEMSHSGRLYSFAEFLEGDSAAATQRPVKFSQEMAELWNPALQAQLGEKIWMEPVKVDWI